MSRKALIDCSKMSQEKIKELFQNEGIGQCYDRLVEEGFDNIDTYSELTETIIKKDFGFKLRYANKTWILIQSLTKNKSENDKENKEAQHSQPSEDPLLEYQSLELSENEYEEHSGDEQYSRDEEYLTSSDSNEKTALDEGKEDNQQERTLIIEQASEVAKAQYNLFFMRYPQYKHYKDVLTQNNIVTLHKITQLDINDKIWERIDSKINQSNITLFLSRVLCFPLLTALEQANLGDHFNTLNDMYIYTFEQLISFTGENKKYEINGEEFEIQYTKQDKEYISILQAALNVKTGESEPFESTNKVECIRCGTKIADNKQLCPMCLPIVKNTIDPKAIEEKEPELDVNVNKQVTCEKYIHNNFETLITPIITPVPLETAYFKTERQKNQFLDVRQCVSNMDAIHNEKIVSMILTSLNPNRNSVKIVQPTKKNKNKIISKSKKLKRSMSHHVLPNTQPNFNNQLVKKTLCNQCKRSTLRCQCLRH